MSTLEPPARISKLAARRYGWREDANEGMGVSWLLLCLYLAHSAVFTAVFLSSLRPAAEMARAIRRIYRSAGMG